MTVRRLVLIFSLSASAVLAQMCDKIDQRDADAILGGPALPMSLGSLGCSFSARGKGARLTLTMSDEGASARQTFDKLKQKTRAGGWLATEEPVMSGMTAYGEMVKASPKNASGKCGFVVLKGSRLIQLYVSDAGLKGDLSVRRETLDRLRPMARRVADSIH